VSKIDKPLQQLTDECIAEIDRLAEAKVKSL
jgi:ribosome recycling factor